MSAPSPVSHAAILKRLSPLYAASFLQGFVLWYVVEKLFMRHIGFDNAGIGVMVAAYSVIMLLVETPSGILADRWSRKGILVIASVALVAASWVGGISHGIPMYLLCAVFWGIFFALYSGAYDSIVYDTLLELRGNADGYERYYGHVKVADGVALVIGSLLGAAVAAHWGLRAPYFLSIPLAVLSAVPLFVFKEPVLHKQHKHTGVTKHIRETFAAVLKKGQLWYVLCALVLMTTVAYLMFEFNQLWLIALALPVAWFGIANSALLSTIGVGGFLVGWLQLNRLRTTQGAIVLMMFASAGLALSHTPVVVVACQVVMGAGVTALEVVFNAMLHDALPSRVRAGASSAAGTLTRLLIIPVSLLFGYVARIADVFTAAWIMVVLLAMTFVAATKIHSTPKAIAVEGEPGVESYQK